MRTKTHSEMKIKSTGLEDKNQKEIAEELRIFLAETYSLYTTSQKFHWNVVGIWFYAMHKFFEEQYLELFKALDVIAERIRALGAMAPGSFSEFQALSSLKEARDLQDAEPMIQFSIEGHRQICEHAREIAHKAEEAEDQATQDLMAERIMAHEKAIWMLTSFLS